MGDDARNLVGVHILDHLPDESYTRCGAPYQHTFCSPCQRQSGHARTNNSHNKLQAVAQHAAIQQVQRKKDPAPQMLAHTCDVFASVALCTSFKSCPNVACSVRQDDDEGVDGLLSRACPPVQCKSDVRALLLRLFPTPCHPKNSTRNPPPPPAPHSHHTSYGVTTLLRTLA
jgi:hypothetical protein